MTIVIVHYTKIKYTPIKIRKLREVKNNILDNT